MTKSIFCDTRIDMTKTKGCKNGLRKHVIPPRHKLRCKICHHEKRQDIELDYVHFIPYKTICERYNINTMNLQHHAIAVGLMDKRDRKAFYNHMLSNFNPDKISAENAIEAAKQLDRIERVVQDNPTPSQIVVNYAWGKALEKGVDDSRAAGDTNRLPAITDAGKVPPLKEAV